jgi:hypothetical protein
MVAPTPGRSVVSFTSEHQRRQRKNHKANGYDLFHFALLKGKNLITAKRP